MSGNPWKIEDGDNISIFDPSGVKRFMGTRAALLQSYVWLMQELDAIRERLPELPSRLEAALRQADFEDEDETNPQSQEDRVRIRHYYEKMKTGEESYAHASSISRQKFIADLLREAIEPLQRAGNNRLTHKEAVDKDQYCPSCHFLNYSGVVEAHSCIQCGKRGYSCCVNEKSQFCFECEMGM